jgi:hypothetical protein
MRTTPSSFHNASSLSPTHTTISHLFLAMKTKKFIQLSFLDCKLPHTSKFRTKNIKNKRKHTHMSNFLPLFPITTFYFIFQITHSNYNQSYQFSLMCKNHHHCSSNTQKETSPLFFHQKKHIAIITFFQFPSTTPNCNNFFSPNQTQKLPSFLSFLFHKQKK